MIFLRGVGNNAELLNHTVVLKPDMSKESYCCF